MRLQLRMHHAVHLTVLQLLLAISISPVLAYASSKNDFCKSIIRDKSNRAFLFDAAGKIALPYFELGKVDITIAEPAEYVIAKRFRIVLFPKRLRLESLSGRDFAADINEIKGRCPFTSEYVVTLRVNPTGVRPGKFDDEFQMFRIVDPRLDFPEYTRVKLGYQDRLVGEVSMPWIQVEAVIQEPASIFFFGVGKKDFSFSLKNLGDHPMQLGRWIDADDLQKKEVIIRQNTCQNISVAPLGLCNITLEKVSEKPLIGNLYSWSTMGTAGNFILPIILDAEKFREGQVGLGIRYH